MGRVFYLLAGYYKSKALYRRGMTTLQLIVDNKQTPPPILEKALFQYAGMYLKIGPPETALNYFHLFIKRFPESNFRDTAHRRIAELEKQ